MRKTFWIFATCTLTLAVFAAGCTNTLRGVGEDTQAAGRAIQKTAD